MNQNYFLIVKKFNDLRRKGLCPVCKKKIIMNEFKDSLSKKEFKISGMCQKCQNKVFGYQKGWCDDGKI